MFTEKRIVSISMLSSVLICGCGGGAQVVHSGPTQGQVATPTISLKAALHGAQVVSLTSTTAGVSIHYTVDGSIPGSSSPVFEAPFLVARNSTVNAVAQAAGSKDSALASQTFAANIPSGTLVWQDDFTNMTGSNQQPDPTVWTYDTGDSGFGNHELENYCAWGSRTTPCDTNSPNAYVGADNVLHVVARKTASGYTSARLKTQGLFSVQYGRLEARIWVPEAQGLWPAFWTLGNNIDTVDWPACGEQDIMERVDSATMPDWNEGSVHGTGFTGNIGLGTRYAFPAGQVAAGWHTYGMIWNKNSVAYYVDDPANPYVSYSNPGSLSQIPGAIWPFDGGGSMFLLINLAVGGDWPGDPNDATPFPAELLVDYVRVYAN